VKIIVHFVVLFWVLTLVSCRTISTSNFHPEKKYSAGELQGDFQLLKNILEANHPSLYWYTPKDAVDNYFNMARASLKDSMNEMEFKNKVAWAISKIRCGHTVVRNSKKYTTYFEKHRFPLFPLSIKIWDDSAVIVNNLNRRDSVLKRGTLITSINNRSMRSIVDSMFQLVGEDGYSDNFKYQLISFNFAAYYRNAFGTDSLYTVHYIDSVGNQKQAKLRNFDSRRDSTTRRITPPPDRITRKEFRNFDKENKRNLVIDSASNTAIINVNTFSEGRLQGFFRRSFKKIKEDNIKHVVLDLRQNSGGSVMACTRLTQYLVDKPFKVADTVAAISRSFRYKSHIKPWFIYWISMHFTGRKMNDDRIHFRYFERHLFKPKTKSHFDGDVYVVTGGYTFSAAALVAGHLKNQQNVTIIGEETGGGFYGNSAMHLPSIVLPKTGIRITLPMYRMVLDSKRPKNGRGVIPDVEVKPSSALIKQAIDGKMQKVQQLIIHKNSSVSN
jgi:hypothetical protein